MGIKAQLISSVGRDDNKITYLSGVPGGARTLQVAGNRLTSLTSVDHLRNLHHLDVSRNQLDSVTRESPLLSVPGCSL